MTPTGYYLETYDSSQRTQYLFSPTAPAVPIDITQITRSHTRDYGGSVNLTYQAAPRVQTTLTGAYNRHQVITDNTGQSEYYTYNGDLAFSYQLGSRSTAGVYGFAQETRYSNDAVDDTYSVGVQGTYAFSQFFTVAGRLGESFLRNKPGNGQPDTTDQSPNGRFSFNYKKLDFNTTGWVSFGYSAGNTTGQTTQQWNAGLALGDQFLSGWWWGLTGWYQANRNIDNPTQTGTTAANGTAEIRYLPVQWATLRLSGTFYREWAQTNTGNDLIRTSAFLGVTLSKPYSLY